jgi:hypothetical protein
MIEGYGVAWGMIRTVAANSDGLRHTRDRRTSRALYCSGRFFDGDLAAGDLFSGDSQLRNSFDPGLR